MAMVLLLLAAAFCAAGTASSQALRPVQKPQRVCQGDTRGDRKCNHDATHRVCAEIGDPKTSFWKHTGQRSWCGTPGDYGGKWGSELRCPAAHPTWCICKWATAAWIKGEGCSDAVNIDCEATDICATTQGLFFSYDDYDVNLHPAHMCAKQKCPRQWQLCEMANPHFKHKKPTPVKKQEKCPQSTWAQRTQSLNNACCSNINNKKTKGMVNGAGHRRMQGVACQLPKTCPSQACAMHLLQWRDECSDLAKAATHGRQSDFNQLYASCNQLASAKCATDALVCDSALINSDESLHKHCHVRCSTNQPTPRDQACLGRSCSRCASKISESQLSTLRDDILSNKVWLYGVSTQEPSTAAALHRLHDASACMDGKSLTQATFDYLRCMYPHEQLQGNQVPTFVFIGGKFFGNGFTLSTVPTAELDRRLKTANVKRTCGRAAEPPPPPPGAIDACVGDRHTAVNRKLSQVPDKCAALKKQLPAKCDSAGALKPWNAFMNCAFQENQWAKYRVSGQGGCSGPTLFAFCEQAFTGDVDKIRCCSNSRCPWSASLFGETGGRPTCISNRYAVNVCCEPCACWLSPKGVSPGGKANMTIREDYGGRSYPVLVNTDGLPIAAPFECGKVGLFGNTDVEQVQTWQRSMGTCSHNPMG